MSIVKFKKLEPTAIIPKYAKEGDAGMDLSFIGYQFDLPDGGKLLTAKLLAPGEIYLASTGLAMELPPHTQGEVRSRSGLSLKGVHVLNAPGTVDEGYRGEMKVILHNAGDKPVVLNIGDRIAQLVVMPYIRCAVEETQELSSSERGAAGFGSTGT